MLEDHPAPGEGPKIKGSVMLAVAHSKEEVIEALKEDVYTKVRFSPPPLHGTLRVHRLSEPGQIYRCYHLQVTCIKSYPLLPTPHYPAPPTVKTTTQHS